MNMQNDWYSYRLQATGKGFPACEKYQQELGVGNCGAISLEIKKNLVK